MVSTMCVSKPCPLPALLLVVEGIIDLVESGLILSREFVGVLVPLSSSPISTP